MAEETKAKYHHLIPQTYMSAWAQENGTLNVEFKNNPGIIEQRNKERIAGITDFHSIKAGYPLCTKEDADRIFASVQPYTVRVDGNVISSTLVLNTLFADYDKWEIIRGDGTSVSKKYIKREIEKVKIKDIEFNWSTKYENNWPAQVAVIEDKVLSATGSSIEAFDREFIMKFFTALDWRGFSSSLLFESAASVLCREILPLDKIDVPEDERMLPSLKTIADEMRHYMLLKFFRQYLDDTGVIYMNLQMNLKHTSFHFLVSDGLEQFITSDSPAFIHKRLDGNKVGLLPITPKILLTQGKNVDNDDKYYITHISDRAVQEYNRIIKENAEEFVILPQSAK